MARKKEIDLLDLQILNQLQVDASITNRKLAEKIDLTPGPTLVRVNNLEKNGYLEKTTSRTINWTKLGYNYRCIVRIALPDAFVTEFVRNAKNVSGVYELVEVARDTHSLSNLRHFSAKCTFKNEQAFIDAWAEVVRDAQYPFDFQVWNIKQVHFKNNPIILTI